MVSRGLGREGCGTQGLTGFSQLQRKGDWRAAGGLQKRVGLPVSSHSVGQGLRDSRGLASPLRGCEAGGRGRRLRFLQGPQVESKRPSSWAERTLGRGPRGGTQRACPPAAHAHLATRSGSRPGDLPAVLPDGQLVPVLEEGERAREASGSAATSRGSLAAHRALGV